VIIGYNAFAYSKSCIICRVVLLLVLPLYLLCGTRAVNIAVHMVNFHWKIYLRRQQIYFTYCGHLFTFVCIRQTHKLDRRSLLTAAVGRAFLAVALACVWKVSAEMCVRSVQQVGQHQSTAPTCARNLHLTDRFRSHTSCRSHVTSLQQRRLLCTNVTEAFLTFHFILRY